MITVTTTTAAQALAQLEAEHAAAGVHASKAQAAAYAAGAALAEVEQAIRTGDNRLGQSDLLERDTAKRTAALVAEGALATYNRLSAELPAARTAVLLAELEDDSPLTRMAEADATLQAAIVAALEEWRAVAAENYRVVNAIKFGRKDYDPRVVSVNSSGMLEINGQGYREIHERSQFDWDRNWQEAKRVIMARDDAEAAALRAVDAEPIRWAV